MVNDNRAINDAPHDVKVNNVPTMGAFIHGTLDIQQDTLVDLDKIVTVLLGNEIKAPSAIPEENVMSGLAAILENQKAILAAVKVITGAL